MLQLLNELTSPRLFNWSFDEFERELGRIWPNGFSKSNRGLVPLNLYTNDQAVKVVARVPGWKAEWFDVFLEGNQLFIKGESKAEADDQAKRSFARVVKLPFRVEEDKVEATYKNGILTIDLHRHQQDAPKKISIAGE